MSRKFKAGDLVTRVGSNFKELVVGGTYEVNAASITQLTLRGYPGRYAVKMFEHAETKAETLKVHVPEGFSLHDVSVEEWRTYHYEDGVQYTVNRPVKLFLKRTPSGDSHRVVDADGITHCPRRDWVALTWKAASELVSF